jgi:hypothetical protein
MVFVYWKKFKNDFIYNCDLKEINQKATSNKIKAMNLSLHYLILGFEQRIFFACSFCGYSLNENKCGHRFLFRLLPENSSSGFYSENKLEMLVWGKFSLTSNFVFHINVQIKYPHWHKQLLIYVFNCVQNILQN